VITMKGYTEDRGLSFKLDYDADTKQFVSKPIEHDFAPRAEPNGIMRKLKDWQARREATAASRRLQEQLSEFTPEMLDDIGMAGILVNGQNPWKYQPPIIGYTVLGRKSP
jgi:hypothetical protein